MHLRRNGYQQIMIKIFSSVLIGFFLMIALSSCASERVYRKAVVVDGEEVEYNIRYFQGVSKEDVTFIINELDNAGKINGFIYSVFKHDKKYVVQLVDDLSRLLTLKPVGLSGQEVRLYKTSSGWVIEDSGTWIQ